jgi:hypothetical protein
MCFFENDYFLNILKTYKEKTFPMLVPIIVELAENHWHKILQESLIALKTILKEIDPLAFDEALKMNPTKKKLYASVFGNRYSIVYSKYKMKLNVDKEYEKLDLIITDLKYKHLSTVSWEFETLIEASSKMQDLLLVFADTQKINNKNYYHYTAGEIYKDFDFDNFLEEIENGGIMFDIRIGVYNSGINFGKTHDHGSGFRVKAANFKNLYCTYEKI